MTYVLGTMHERLDQICRIRAAGGELKAPGRHGGVEHGTATVSHCKAKSCRQPTVSTHMVRHKSLVLTSYGRTEMCLGWIMGEVGAVLQSKNCRL